MSAPLGLVSVVNFVFTVLDGVWVEILLLELSILRLSHSHLVHLLILHHLHLVDHIWVHLHLHVLGHLHVHLIGCVHLSNLFNNDYIL